MKKVIWFGIVLLILINTAIAGWFDTGTTFTPSESNVTYNFTTNVTFDSLVVGTHCMNLTGGSNPGNYCENRSSPTIIQFPDYFNATPPAPDNDTTAPNIKIYYRNQGTSQTYTGSDLILYDTAVGDNHTLILNVSDDSLYSYNITTDSGVLKIKNGVSINSINYSIKIATAGNTLVTGGSYFYNYDEYMIVTYTNGTIINYTLSDTSWGTNNYDGQPPYPGNTTTRENIFTWPLHDPVFGHWFKFYGYNSVTDAFDELETQFLNVIEGKTLNFEVCSGGCNEYIYNNSNLLIKQELVSLYHGGATEYSVFQNSTYTLSGLTEVVELYPDNKTENKVHWVKVEACDNSSNCANETYYWYKPNITYTVFQNNISPHESHLYTIEYYFNTSWVDSSSAGLFIDNSENTPSLVTNALIGDTRYQKYQFSKLYLMDDYLDGSVNLSWNTSFASTDFSIDIFQGFQQINFSNVTYTHINATDGSNLVENYSLQVTDGLGSDQTFTTTNGSIYFYALLDNSYSMTIDPEGNYTTVIKTVVPDTAYFNYTFQVFEGQRVDIYFYDSDTGNLIDSSTIRIQFIGDTAQTLTTTDGTLTVSNLTSDTYTLLYNATGYQQGKYIQEIAANVYLNLSLYMQVDDNSQLVLITVNDRFGTELQAVTVVIQKWSNDKWITDQIVETDFQGHAEAYYVISDVYYNHVLKYEGDVYYGAINDDENKKLIYTEDVSNGITFYIDLLGDSLLQEYQETYDVDHNLNYTETGNGTGYFRYFWTHENNEIVYGCLDVYHSSTMTPVAGCTNICSNTSTGTVYCYINETGAAVYVAKASIGGYNVNEMIKKIGMVAGDIDWGSVGYALSFILVVVSFFAFITNATISTLVGTGVFVLLIFFGVIFKDINYAYLVSIMAIGFMIATIRSKSGVNA